MPLSIWKTFWPPQFRSQMKSLTLHYSSSMLPVNNSEAFAVVQWSTQLNQRGLHKSICESHVRSTIPENDDEINTLWWNSPKVTQTWVDASCKFHDFYKWRKEEIYPFCLQADQTFRKYWLDSAICWVLWIILVQSVRKDANHIIKYIQ